MRLSLDQRVRLVFLFVSHHLRFVKKKFGKLKELCQREEIIISTKGAANLIKKWQTLGTVRDITSQGRRKLLISQYQLAVIDRAVYRNREYTGRALKSKYRIRSSARSIRRYIRRLGKL